MICRRKQRKRPCGILHFFIFRRGGVFCFSALVKNKIMKEKVIMEKKNKTFDGVLLKNAVIVGDPLVFETSNPPLTRQTSRVQKVVAQGTDLRCGSYLVIETSNTIYTLLHVKWFNNSNC